jgi:hypothetical protein
MIESEGITENVRSWRTDVPARLIEALGLERIMFEAADREVFAWYVEHYGACARYNGARTVRRPIGSYRVSREPKSVATPNRAVRNAARYARFFTRYECFIVAAIRIA